MAGAVVLAALAAALGAAYAYWRWVWFWRNPPRVAPEGEDILSAADGVVVYARKVAPGEPVVSIKQGNALRIEDLVHEHAAETKLVIGVFMSPFDVHYNRAPLSGVVDFVRHYPGRGKNLDMGAMHRRILLKRPPYYEASPHIAHNERTVTKIDGQWNGAALSCYVVQIAARTVAGIDSYFEPGRRVERGATFGMIRIGSQVDIVLPWSDAMAVRVAEGDRVRAGETVLVGRSL